MTDLEKVHLINSSDAKVDEARQQNSINEDVQQDEAVDTEQFAQAVNQDLNNSKEYQFPDEMTILECFWLVTKMSIPLVLGMLFFILVQLTNTWYIGNQNDPKLLAGVGMGNMLINVLCFAVTQGLNGALESLISQSFGA